MAAPPPPPKSLLEALPSDLHHQILLRVPCHLDRAPVALACRTLRDAVRRQKGHPPPLPWVLLPTTPAPDRVACVLAGCSVHHHLTVDPPGARWFGSHDGAWLLLNCRDGVARGNRAVNLRTGLFERLPTSLQGLDGVIVDDMVILAAALSSSPDDGCCVAAAIVLVELAPALRLRCLAMWRKGWEMATEPVLPPAGAIGINMEVDDLVFHRGGFHMVTRDNHIHICTPESDQHDGGDLLLRWETRRFQVDGVICGDDQYIHARYLVSSRGELLLVLRFTPEPNQSTSKFKVFQATAADAGFPWAWRQLFTLGGRMLFVGQGCSRAYEAADDRYPGFREGIYFLDDGQFYDIEVLFGAINFEYPCSDNGMWTEDGHVQRCFPRSDPSANSAPVWLLP